MDINDGSAKIKQPKTYEEQVAIIKEKGFIVEDEQECIAFLKKANYYRLSAYFLPFKRKDGSYVPETKFDKVAHIYEFDGRMRAVLFQCIEEIEFYLRTQFSYFSGHTYGALGYLNDDNYSDKHKGDIFRQKINKCIKDNSQTRVVTHHMEKYGGKFPIWVIIEFFSMGMLSHFFADLKTNDQKTLAKELYEISPRFLNSWLKCITDLRNQCAHYSRLYSWIFTATPAIPKEVNFKANRKLFSQLMMLKFLYPEKNRWNAKIFTEIEALIEEYKEYISLNHIGFPKNWEKLLKF